MRIKNIYYLFISIICIFTSYFKRFPSLIQYFIQLLQRWKFYFSSLKIKINISSSWINLPCLELLRSVTRAIFILLSSKTICFLFSLIVFFDKPLIWFLLDVLALFLFFLFSSGHLAFCFALFSWQSLRIPKSQSFNPLTDNFAFFVLSYCNLSFCILKLLFALLNLPFACLLELNLIFFLWGGQRNLLSSFSIQMSSALQNADECNWFIVKFFPLETLCPSLSKHKSSFLIFPLLLTRAFWLIFIEGTLIFEIRPSSVESSTKSQESNIWCSQACYKKLKVIY